jgi:hypothetical protein
MFNTQGPLLSNRNGQYHQWNQPQARVSMQSQNQRLPLSDFAFALAGRFPGHTQEQVANILQSLGAYVVRPQEAPQFLIYNQGKRAGIPSAVTRARRGNVPVVAFDTLMTALHQLEHARRQGLRLSKAEITNLLRQTSVPSVYIPQPVQVKPNVDQVNLLPQYASECSDQVTTLLAAAHSALHQWKGMMDKSGGQMQIAEPFRRNLQGLVRDAQGLLFEQMNVLRQMGEVETECQPGLEQLYNLMPVLTQLLQHLNNYNSQDVQPLYTQVSQVLPRVEQAEHFSILPAASKQLKPLNYSSLSVAPQRRTKRVLIDETKNQVRYISPVQQQQSFSPSLNEFATDQDQLESKYSSLRDLSNNIINNNRNSLLEQEQEKQQLLELLRQQDPSPLPDDDVDCALAFDIAAGRAVVILNTIIDLEQAALAQPPANLETLQPALSLVEQTMGQAIAELVPFVQGRSPCVIEKALAKRLLAVLLHLQRTATQEVQQFAQELELTPNWRAQVILGALINDKNTLDEIRSLLSQLSEAVDENHPELEEQLDQLSLAAATTLNGSTQSRLNNPFQQEAFDQELQDEQEEEEEQLSQSSGEESGTEAPPLAPGNPGFVNYVRGMFGY